MTPEEARKVLEEQKAINESRALAETAASPELIAARKCVEELRKIVKSMTAMGRVTIDLPPLALAEYDKVVKG